MSSRPITSLQSEVQAWSDQHWQGEYWPVHANLARLTEEVGEIARAVNQHYGPKRVKTDEVPVTLAEELADALFVLLCLANSTDIELQDVFDEMFVKYQDRDEQR